MEDPVTAAPSTSNLALPLPAIICIAIGAYIVVIVIILVIRQILMSRGVCGPCSCCGKEGEACCTCCAACGERCNCDTPNLKACMDTICGPKKNLTCADIIMCQCCSDPNNQCCSCCGGDEPLCDCGQCNCNCQCQPPECTDVNCLCFTLAPKAPGDDDGDVGIYP